MTSITYAVPDLHGRDDLLEAAIAAISARGGGRVVFLGDYVDRGPGSRQVIERLMAGPPEEQIWIILKGNHEDMMVETCRGRAVPDWWIGNGGGATLVSYGHPRSGVADLSVVPADHIAWIAGLSLAFADEHRVYAHAGVDPTLPLGEQTAKTLTWKRYPKGFDGGCDGLHVVHGHTPDRDGPERLVHRTNLDTLSWYTGRLAVGVFDDAVPGGPVEVMWIESYPFEHLVKAA